MKNVTLKLFFGLLLLGILPSVNAQNTFDVGTQWYYQDADYPAFKANVLEVTGDTTIAGQVCSVLDGECSCGPFIAVKYIYKADGKVFVYNENTAAFSLLYDYTAMPGDTIFIDIIDNTPTARVIIDSLGQITQGGVVHQVQYFHSWGVEWGDYFIENIGSNACFFPLSPVCDPQTGPIRCYINDAQNIDYHFESYWFSLDFPCDTSVVFVGLEEVRLAKEVIFYPNPFFDYLEIVIPAEWANQKVVIQLQDALGKMVWVKSYYIKNENRIQLHDGVDKLPEGHYFAQVKGENFIAAFKLIKQ